MKFRRLLLQLDGKSVICTIHCVSDFLKPREITLHRYSDQQRSNLQTVFCLTDIPHLVHQCQGAIVTSPGWSDVSVYLLIWAAHSKRSWGIHWQQLDQVVHTDALCLTKGSYFAAMPKCCPFQSAQNNHCESFCRSAIEPLDLKFPIDEYSRLFFHWLGLRNFIRKQTSVFKVVIVSEFSRTVRKIADWTYHIPTPSASLRGFCILCHLKSKFGQLLHWLGWL